MAPVLEPKDIVFIKPATQCEKDDIVAIRHPHKKTILIKYVKEIDENNLVELSSPTGTDSKEFGKAALKHLIGVATYNYSQKKTAYKRKQLQLNKIVKVDQPCNIQLFKHLSI